MPRKTKILIVGEYSQFNTGFATYFYYLLPRLFKTGKYEIAELGVYLHAQHPKMETTPWQVFPNEPSPNEPEHVHKAYGSDPINQFGKFRFNQTCLTFKPDIVINIADPWMASWINQSPYRKHFHYIHMPTVDGQVQKYEWIEDYKACDTVLTYSEFGRSTIEHQSGNKIKVKAVASPGSDNAIFKPATDKNAVKQSLGLPKDSFIIQTVMRNQPRKLFPEILKSFNDLLQKMRENHENTDNVFLHFHTSNPDMGWDLPTEIKNHGLSHKVFLTYMCDKCGLIRCFNYRHDKTVCPRCGESALRLPNTSAGCTREQLAVIMSAADIYLQYSICEGFGMPIVDAKSCGVPTVVVGYSAMREMGTEESGGRIVEVEKFWQEPNTNTNQLRAVPNNKMLVDILRDLITEEGYAEKLGKNAREWSEKYYNWDRTAAIWENVLDSISVEEVNSWFKDFKFLPTITELPSQIASNADFVRWICDKVLQNPELLYTQEAKNWITWLNQGFMNNKDVHGRMYTQVFNPEVLVNMVNERVQQINYFEQARYEYANPSTNKRKEKIGVTI